MNARVVVILVVLAFLAAGGAFFVLRDQGTSSSGAAALGQPLFAQLKAAEVARIVIQDPRGTLTLEKKDQRWLIAERGGFPADLGRVTELVVKLIELKTGQSEPIGEQERARMQLGVPGKGEGAATAVTLKGQDGKTLAELLVGKKYFRTAPEGDATKALGDGRFVMLASDATRVITVADPLKQATTATAEWIARDGFVVENVKSIEVKLAEGGYRLERDTQDGPWKLDGKGGELDQGRASGPAYALAKLEVEDLPAPGIEAGFEQGSQVTATTFDGLEYRLKLGKLDGERYVVQGTVEGTPARPGPAARDGEKPEDKEKREKAFAEETKRLADRIAREKALAPFNVLVAKAKFADVLKNRSDLLKEEAKQEAKDEKKKPGDEKKK